MTIEHEADVVVVGAGPGGATAARVAAQAGARVVLIDKRVTLGEPVQCAEYLPLLALPDVPDHRRFVTQRIESMETFWPDGTSQRVRAPGVILDRGAFDKGLSGEAGAAGATVLTRTVAKERIADGILARCGSEDVVIRAEVVIGADGVDSTIASWLGQRNALIMTAMQHEVVLQEPAKPQTEVFMGEDYPRGYGWLFPKGRTANVGVGVLPATAAKDSLAALMDRLTDAGRIGSVVGTTQGRIPVNGPLLTLNGNIALIGDAGGACHPITGAGIANAMATGKLIGRHAAQVAQTGDISYLDLFESEWRMRFLGPLSYAAAKRAYLNGVWDDCVSDGVAALTSLTQECWVTTRAYYDKPAPTEVGAPGAGRSALAGLLGG